MGERVLANGRDPYFPAWPDVVQLNAFSPDLRAAVIETLDAIADQCDGVRCDMAMLMMNDAFERTWGGRAGGASGRGLLADGGPGRSSAAHPDFVFLAEAYWDLEWALQQQGFDYCYDKRLYDRLVHEGAEQVHGHLTGDAGYQRKLVRFIENHDEPRAAATFPPGKAQAAAVTTLSQTGARLVHEGQLDGRTGCTLPVFLARRPDEAPDAELRAFYERLLAALGDGVFRDGEWQLGERSGWEGNDTWQNLVCWGWRGGSPRKLVVVNLGDVPAVRPRVAAVGRPARRGRGCSTTPPRASATSGAATTSATASTWRWTPWRWHLFDLTPGDSRRTDRCRHLPTAPTAEHARLAEATGRAEDDLFSANPWYEWGPYLSERAWGTVREDYSESGDAWELLPARPRPLARVPLERGRHGRHLRHPPRAVPRARALERATTRSSRSGCSG